MKKTFRIKIMVRDVVNCDQEFIDKFHKNGVLGSQDLEYDLSKEQYESSYFRKVLMDYIEDLLQSLIFTEIEEVKNQM